MVRADTQVGRDSNLPDEDRCWRDFALKRLPGIIEPCPRSRKKLNAQD